MKIRSFLYWSAAVAFILTSCNKDEEIIGDGDGFLGGFATDEFTVLEYMPAPGQFINEKVSGFHNVVTMEEACRYAQERLEKNDFVSLGAWGGYIIVRTPVKISNSGGYDFSIGGNAFDTSNEPGIVWVMEDTNGNGKADDQWYELKGSCFEEEGYERDYWVTYYRPSEKGQDIEWVDCHGERGSVKWMGTFHSQDSYYPEWIKEGSYTLIGTRLPHKAVQNPASGVWENPPFKWGYADNLGEDSSTIEVKGKAVQMNFFRISDAVDGSGDTIALEGIDFIKVQTAVRGEAGVVGENSTEVTGFFLTTK